MTSALHYMSVWLALIKCFVLEELEPLHRGSDIDVIWHCELTPQPWLWS